MEMSQKIWWHELSTWDAKTAIAFYEYTLGWKFWPTTLPDGESYWIASKDGQPVGSIFELSNPQHEGIPAHWMTYMQVPDILEAQSAAATAGLGLLPIRPLLAQDLAEPSRLDVPYGEVYRVGRKGSTDTWPVSGGSVANIATPRAISFEPIAGTKKFLGHGGQTSTQIVLLTKPPRSWTLLPLGESDRNDSPHFDDQAERLFSKGTMKPTYFLDKSELIKHVESKTVVFRDVD